MLGVVLTVLESTRFKKWTPSPTGLGIGMLVPGSAIVTMFLGALVSEFWPKSKDASATGSDGENRTKTALASGFIAGEVEAAAALFAGPAV